MRRKTTYHALAVVVAAVVGASGAAAAPAESLELNESLTVVSTLGPCPAGLAPSSICAARSSSGRMRGLGSVRIAYTWGTDLGPPACEQGQAKVLGYDVLISVAGKGDLNLTVAAGGRCVGQEAVRDEPQSFTVVGGTGAYQGASGGGTVERVLGQTATGAAGRETWIGTLAVPGLAFDVVAPVLAGVVGRSVRVPASAKRTRVRFAVSARDAVDGAVAVACQPRSGAWFRLGRTIVRCSASDSSGNETTGSFAVLVRRSR